MRLPRPGARESLHAYSNRLGRSSLPLGAGKSYKAKKWCKRPLNYRQQRRSKGVVFSMDGECMGSLSEVLELGQALAREAMDAGDTDWAAKVINRLKALLKDNLETLKAELKVATA